MKHLLTSLKYLAAVALLVVTVGCANQIQEKQNLLVAAGFKIITPTTAAQRTLLPTLPEGQVTRITVQGTTYFVMPDVANNQAFVGGAPQYQAYQQLRLAKRLSNQNLMAAQHNAHASMNWNTWGGWGRWNHRNWR